MEALLVELYLIAFHLASFLRFTPVNKGESLSIMCLHLESPKT